MIHDEHDLARLLRSFFNAAELRQFLGAFADGKRLLTHLPASIASHTELCTEAAALLARWGTSEAELFERLHESRPTRLPELMAYHRHKAVAMSSERRGDSLELIASIDGDAAAVYHLYPGQIRSIGRSSEAEIQFPVDLIKLSRLHAWVFWPPEGPQIQDLGSKNGTWLNSRRIARARLHRDDQLQLGEVHMRVHEPDRTETAVPESDTLS